MVSDHPTKTLGYIINGGVFVLPSEIRLIHSENARKVQRREKIATRQRDVVLSREALSSLLGSVLLLNSNTLSHYLETVKHVVCT